MMECEEFTVSEEIELSELGILLYEYPVEDGVLTDEEIDYIERFLRNQE